MTLSSGTRLGSYEVLAPIGKGGMGEVWKARDTKLGRDVALKILPATFASDPDRMTRFEREARVLASLDHPNIAAIYGIEESDGVRALVLALINGPTLAERIAAGPIPLDEAIQIARQVAEAVEYAHERGVIHRDLKPANIKITSGGMVKVLDFGLAKALDDEPAAGSGTNSPTLTIGATKAGVLLGTAAYMSPEQAKGKQADRRSDIWSFGAVLYEMVTGKAPFSGETVGDTLASVIKDEPKLDDVPAGVRSLVGRCLTKDARQRLQAIGEARVALEQPTAPAHVISPVKGRSPWSSICAGVLLIALGVVSFVHFREKAPVEHILRYNIAVPDNSTVHSFAVSPDGRYVVIAAAIKGKQQLWLHRLDALQAQPLPTSEDATYPFWSPDSRYIGFFADGKLKKINASGGPAQSLCDATQARGGTWNRNEVIVFSQYGLSSQGIHRVAAAGGIAVDVLKEQGVLRYPAFLPDSKHFLYTDIRTSDKSGLYVATLDGSENRRLLTDRSAAVFAPSSPGTSFGHLLFVRDNNLMALPFDAASAQPTGDVFPVAEGVLISGANTGYVPVTVSENGVLLYWTGSAAGANRMSWYDRTGKLLGTVGELGYYLSPAISHNEKLLAFTRSTVGGGTEILLRDLNRATDLRLMTGGQNHSPLWSPMDDRIAFTALHVGAKQWGIYQKEVSSTVQDQFLTPLGTNSTSGMSSQWSLDGKYIVYTSSTPNTKQDLWVLPMDSTDRKPFAFLKTEFNESLGQLSPDGRWMAYTSDESGRPEIYVRPFPSGEGRWKISTAGGQQSRWRGDGKELFYQASDGKMTAVATKGLPGPKPSFEAGVPVPLFEWHAVLPSTTIGVFQYDVSADGKRFLLVTNDVSAAAAPPLTVFVNWTAALNNK